MLKNIILDMLALLDETSLQRKVEGISIQSNLDDELQGFETQEKDKIKSLADSAVNVLNSITRSYIKNLTTEHVKSDSEGRIYFKDLSKSVISIKDVADKMNSPIVFNVYFDHIKTACKNQDLMISYYFEHEKLTSLL